jgi:hypothetical protein
MMELLYKFDAGELIGLIAVLGTVLAGLICGSLGIVMGVGLAMRKTELNASLKRTMLERGMSADEIRMVINAGSHESLEHAKQPAYQEV